MDRARRTSAAIVVLAAIVAAVYVATIRPGHDWLGDDCMYVLHAQNLLEGRPYAETPLLYNAADGRVPVSYPPVFPLVIAPGVAAFGADFDALKVVSIGFFAVSLPLLAWSFRRRLPAAAQLGLVVFVALNPVLWLFKDHVLSEFVFLFFALATLGLADLADRVDSRRGRVALGIAIGIAGYLCYGTRAVGGLAIASVVAVDLLRSRRIGLPAAVGVGVFTPLLLLQNLLLHSEAAHLSYKIASLSGSLVATNLLETYPRLLRSFWDVGLGEGWAFSLAIASALLALAGFVEAARRRQLGALDVFFLGYVAFFLTIGHADVDPEQRYLIPVFPIYAAYVVSGLTALAETRARLRLALAFGLATVFVLGFGHRYTTIETGPFEDGASSASARSLYAFIARETDPGDVLVFFEPRTLVLYTGRAASQFLHDAETMDEHATWAREIGADYWVDTGQLQKIFPRPLRARFENDSFQVYTIDELFPRPGRRAGARPR